MLNKLAEIEVGTASGKFPFKVFEEMIPHMQAIFGDKTYPIVPFVADVETIIDVGANIGIAAVYFACAYPNARILAFEPAPYCFDVLAANVRSFSGIEIFNKALYSETRQARLYHGSTCEGANSVGIGNETLAEFDVISLERADRVLKAENVTRADIVKIDTEGCELPIMSTIQDLVQNAKIIYLEFHSERDRRRIDDMLHDNFVLYHAASRLNRGDVCYVARSAFPTPAEVNRNSILVSFF